MNANGRTRTILGGSFLALAAALTAAATSADGRLHAGAGLQAERRARRATS